MHKIYTLAHIHNLIDMSTTNESKTIYGGFWIRFVAFIIDSIIIDFLEIIIILPILGAFGVSIGGLEGLRNMENWTDVALVSLIAGVSGTLIITSLVVQWLYYALMHSSNWQATLGKRAVGLKVVDGNDVRINFTTASLRYLGKIVSGLILCIGFIMAAFSVKKQALHDMIASTYVIRVKNL